MKDTVCIISDNDELCAELRLVLGDQYILTRKSGSSAVDSTGPALFMADLACFAPDPAGGVRALATRHTEVDIVIIAPIGAEAVVEALLDLEQVDFVSYPLAGEMMRMRIRRALVRRKLAAEAEHLRSRLEDRTEELQDMQSSVRDLFQGSLETLLRALDWRERETRSHSCRVALAGVSIARTMGRDMVQLRQMLIGGLLHDIGKIGVPDSVLLKAEPLTPIEWEWMRKHPEMGCDIVTKTTMLGEARDIVLSHHERFDGTGYPFGLSGRQIPEAARIFAVADALDAITTDRPYRKAQSFEVAVAEIARGSGTQFDPEVVGAFYLLTEADWIRIRLQSAQNAWRHLEASLSQKALSEMFEMVFP